MSDDQNTTRADKTRQLFDASVQKRLNSTAYKKGVIAAYSSYESLCLKIDREASEEKRMLIYQYPGCYAPGMDLDAYQMEYRAIIETLTLLLKNDGYAVTLAQNHLYISW